MAMVDTASSRSAPAGASLHDKILIVDFGSQVTQLIARRVREEKVYCEIVPFQKAAEAFVGVDISKVPDKVRASVIYEKGFAECEAKKWNDAITTLTMVSFQPRNAPIIASILTSPNPMPSSWRMR